MAVKFSEFTAKTDASVDVTEVVGYLTSGELNVRIPPANLDTTYVVSTGNAGASPTINLQGTKSGQAAAISPSTVSLTGSGATLLNGDGSTTIDFASTEYRLNADDVGSPGTIPVKLSGSGGGDTGDVSTVNLVGAGTVQITSSSNTITIDGGSTGDVTSFDVATGSTSTGAPLTAAGSGAGPYTGAVTVAANIYAGGSNVGMVPSGGGAGEYLDGATGTWTTLPGGGSGTVTSVGLDVTAIAAFNSSGGTNPVTTTGDLTIGITGGAAGQFLDYTGAWSTPAGGGGFGSVDQFQGTGSALGALTLSSTPTAPQNCLISISGVTQNYLDSSGVANWSVSTNTLTFAFNPPVTAVNGIQITVIA